jgi:hypothetical protein
MPCPDCAEEVAEAALTCQFCGCDLAAARESGLPPPPPLIKPQPTAGPAGSRWPFVTAAIGGFLLGAGGLLACVQFVMGLFGSGAKSLGEVGLVSLFAGGLVLAAGWGGLLSRGVGGIVVLLGSLAVPAGIVAAALAEGDELLWSDFLLLAGPCICAALHWVGLEGERGFEGARLGAGLTFMAFAVTALGGRHLDFPDWLELLFLAIGAAGIAGLGFGLAGGLATRRE